MMDTVFTRCIQDSNTSMIISVMSLCDEYNIGHR